MGLRAESWGQSGCAQVEGGGFPPPPGLGGAVPTPGAGPRGALDPAVPEGGHSWPLSGAVVLADCGAALAGLCRLDGHTALGRSPVGEGQAELPQAWASSCPTSSGSSSGPGPTGPTQTLSDTRAHLFREASDPRLGSPSPSPVSRMEMTPYFREITQNLSGIDPKGPVVREAHKEQKKNF